MRLAAVTPSASNPLDTERDGRALAIQLLEELDSEGAEVRCSIDPQWWKRGRVTKQQLPFSRYLQALRDRNNKEVERGFWSVLTDFMVNCLAGGMVPDLASYAEPLGSPKA